ncbi:MAG: hypothetical protein NTU57_01095 [Candidatus Aenigmarchaeota archaeon]|nr:hypothetical protein [Candidatus Aenigmarchaeota archaeon]
MKDVPDGMATTSDVANYLGISPTTVRRYLTPADKLGNSNVYKWSDVKKLEIEMGHTSDATEALSPENIGIDTGSFDASAVLYDALNRLSKNIRRVTRERNGLKVEAALGPNGKYTGDNVVEGVTHVTRYRRSVESAELFKYIPLEDLVKKRVFTPSYDMKKLRKIGPNLVSRVVIATLKDIEKYCKENGIEIEKIGRKKLATLTSDFRKKTKTKIPPVILKEMIEDRHYGKISAGAVRDYATDILKSCIKKTPYTRELKVRLTAEYRNSVQKIIEEVENNATKQTESEINRLFGIDDI